MTSADDYQKRVAQLSTENNYQQSSSVSDANAKLSEVNAGKPADYTNQDADNLAGLYDQILNRQQYSYDPTKDSAFQDYRAAANQMGQQATQQTQSAVQGINGGYGDDWTNRAAGQQYGEYVRTLNDVLPEFEQNAYSGYTSDTDRLTNMYDTALQRDETAYGRYRDTMTDWQNDRDYAATQADNAYSRDYQAYSDAMNNAMTSVNWVRDDANTAQSDAYSWALQLIQQGIMPTADVLATAGITEEDALKLAKKHGYHSGSSGHGSGSGSGSGSSGSGGSNGGSGTTPGITSGYTNPLGYSGY